MDMSVLADQQELIYLQLCADTGCRLEDLLRAIDNRDGAESVKFVQSTGLDDDEI